MNPYTINLPESEVDFEKLCLELLKRHWSRKGGLVSDSSQAG
jgi:hypothetical protein